MKRSARRARSRDDANGNAFDLADGQTLGTTRVNDPMVAEVLRLMRASVAKPLTITELSKRVRMSRRTLEQRFRSVLGRSPMKVIRQLSLARAAQMMRETEEPIKAIVAWCGFGSPAHLCVVFRRAYGMSPSDYRRRAAGGTALRR